ncbi:putative HIBYL-CoA-H type containing protein [Tanacetum coccineum]|uniref:3-hydroxyisobutyryl-CoA hydrolase n=1 Tax=Tanacetum coccineum TaxID=301880 RepID=A0ABQ5FG57_9ASTR
MGESGPYLGEAARCRVCSHGGSDTLLSGSALAHLSQSVFVTFAFAAMYGLAIAALGMHSTIAIIIEQSLEIRRLCTISSQIQHLLSLKLNEEIKIRLDTINQCFSGDSCEEILSSFERLAVQVQEKWIHNAITSIKAATPLGLKNFLRLIREGRSKTLKQCLETGYIAICHILGIIAE